MSVFGWGPTDNSTRTEREAWKNRAREQMPPKSPKKPTTKKSDDSPGDPKHARRRGLF